MILQVCVILATASHLQVLGQLSIEITPCDNPGKGVLQAIRAEPCTTNPCQLKKDTEVEFSFVFLADQDTKTATLDSRASILGIDVPIPGVETNLCRGAIECPVRKGEIVKGSFSLHVPSLPLKGSTVKVRIYADEGLTSCFSFPVGFV